MEFWFWKEAFVPDEDVALERARAGAEWLESKYGSDWHVGIDAEQLDIGSPFRCILGQLYQVRGILCCPSPRRGVNCGFGCGIILDTLSLVIPIPAARRSFERLTAAWRVVLAELRDVVPGTDRSVVREDVAVPRREGRGVESLAS